MPTVVLVGTLDTKGAEYDFVRAQLHGAGVETVTIDCGVLLPPLGHADISREEVARAAGEDIAALAAAGDRGRAVQAMSLGAEAIVLQLYNAGRLQAALALGGTGGTSLAARAFRALPLGVPKLIVSTAASGDTSAIVRETDLMLCPSVVDVAGVNRISARILSNAAHAVAGMAKAGRTEIPDARPLIGASMFGVTTPGVTAARRTLEADGFEILTFHMTGTGGRTLESLVSSGLLQGVLDLTTTELADELVGGVFSAGPERLTVSGPGGVPRVVSVGALDMVNWGPRGTVPERFATRNHYVHNANITLMRTTPDECTELGRRLAQRVARLQAPVTVMLPLRGVSSLAVEGAAFHDPVADEALFQAVRTGLAGSSVRLIEMDTDINDARFAATAASAIKEMIAAQPRGASVG